MFLRNYYNIMASLMLGVMSAEKRAELIFGDGSIVTKAVNGTLYMPYVSTTSSAYMYLLAIGRATSVHTTGSSVISAPRILFGAGDTAVTYNDYALANEVKTGFTKSSFMVTNPVCDTNTNKFTSSISCVVTNSSGSELTFKEMGITFDYYGVPANSSSTTNKTFLVYREILDEPITIADGDSVKYTHTFEFTMPTIE